MKFPKILFAMGLGCIAMLMFIAPAMNVGAQTGITPTPNIVTATPVGAGNPVVSTPGGSPVSPASTDATAVPREFQAFRAARVVLQNKLGKNLRIVTAWTWELMLFHDSALGCAASGQTAAAGDNAGYRITIRPLGDANTYELRVTFDLGKVYDCGIAGTAPGGAPLPGGNGTVAPGPFEVGGQIQDFNSGTVTSMRSAKMKWVKRQLAPGDGSGPAIIAAAHSQNFKVLLSVKGDRSQVLAAGYFDTYASFVGGLAAGGADAIEIWNEQNIDREWPTGQINPATYTQLLQKAYAAIKAANGSALVISGALSPTGFAGAAGKTDAVWNDDVYYQGMAAAGAGQFADCIGVHYNEGVVSPTQSSGDPRDNYPTRYFASMLSRATSAFPGKSACFTELGYLTPEGYSPLPGSFAWAQNTTIAQQAQWLSQAAVAASQSGRVRLMIIFNVDFTYYGADPQAGYAMIRLGGACPACAALAGVLP